MLHLTLNFKTAKDLYPNLKKPPLPLKIPDHESAAWDFLKLNSPVINPERVKPSIWNCGMNVVLHKISKKGPKQ